MRKLVQALAVALFVVLFFNACAKNKDGPIQTFLPEVIEPEGVDAAQRRAELCRPELVRFDEGKLNAKNFRGIFNCANYDGKLNALEPMINSSAFPDLMSSVNQIVESDQTETIYERLQSWFQVEKNGESKIDRLLPIVAKVIRNIVFQKSIPVVAAILNHGDEVWERLLPNLAKLLYNPDYPEFFQKLRLLWNAKQSIHSEYQSSITTRNFADFLQKKHEGKTNVRRILLALRALEDVDIPGTNLYEMFDQANIRGTFTTLYKEAGGNVRGEEVHPDLNENKAEEREARLRLFQRKNGEERVAFLQLVGLLHSFNQARPDFLSAIAKWIGRNKEKIHQRIFLFIGRELLNNEISKYEVKDYLQAYYKKALKKKVPNTKCKRISCKLKPEEFAAFLSSAFHFAGDENFDSFTVWLQKELAKRSSNSFGKRNSQLLAETDYATQIAVLYQREEIISFAKKLVEEKGRRGKIKLKQGIQKFSKLHLSSNPKNAVILSNNDGKELLMRRYFSDLWLNAAQESWGKDIVLDFAYSVLIKIMNDFVADFEKENPNTTLSQWIMNGTYTDPSFLETIFAYLFADPGILNDFEPFRSTLVEEIGPKIFCTEDKALQNEKDCLAKSDDFVAFKLLVEQIPNIWLYIKSGSLRSSANLNRALSENNNGFLIKDWMNFISATYEAGIIELILPTWNDFSLFFEEYDDRVELARIRAKEYFFLKEQESKVKDNWAVAKRALMKKSSEQQVAFQLIAAEQVWYEQESFLKSLTKESKAAWEHYLEVEEIRSVRKIHKGTQALAYLGDALLTPKIELEYSTSMAGHIIKGLKPLVNEHHIADTEAFVFSVVKEALASTDKEIDDFYQFFQQDDPEINAMVEDKRMLQRVSEIMEHQSFPEVLRSLDQLFQEKTVRPALNFIADKIEDGTADEILLFIRRVTAIRNE